MEPSGPHLDERRVRRLGGREGPRTHARPALRHGRLRGHPRLRHRARARRSSATTTTSTGCSARPSCTTCRSRTRSRSCAQATHELIARNGLRACYIRPLVFRGYGPMGLYPLDAPGRRHDRRLGVGRLPRRGGQAATASAPRSSSWRRISPRLADPARQGLGPVPQLACSPRSSRHKAGYEEAILLDDHGYVCEGIGREHLRRARRRDRHAGRRRRRSSTASTAVGHPDRARPRLRGRRARHRARRALPRRRGLHDRHRRRARRRCARSTTTRSATAGPASHARAPDARSRTRCTAARALREWLDVVRHRARRDAPMAPNRRRLRTARRSATARRSPSRLHDSHIQLYDTTLRDGMQGEGMSLSAEEKLRVAHALDELGIAPDRGRLPGLQPQGAASCSSCSRARRFEHAADRRVRDDAPARRRAPTTTTALRVLADSLRAGLHAGRQDLGAAPREGRAGRPRGEPAR